MATGYDNAAWFYDALSRVVLGDAPMKAQSYFLNEIPLGSRVLIAGGGTGKLLEEISKKNPAKLNITYVELSPKMMQRARKRKMGANGVQFKQMPVQDLNVKPFDVIITPFLLDSIPANQFQTTFAHLDSLLKPGGLWLNTDFQLTGKWWQKPLLKAMYLFFSLMGCVDVNALPPIVEAFAARHYHLLDKKMFYGDFMAAELYFKSKS